MHVIRRGILKQFLRRLHGDPRSSKLPEAFRTDLDS
jgi:hypothetical protein